jgi:hypothetical protein
VSRASNLGPGDANGLVDAFVRDLSTGATERVSVTPTGGDSSGNSMWAPAISADGRVVAFTSEASNLVPGDGNAETDVFARDRGAPVGAVGLRAERDGGRVLVSGAVTASGVPSEAEDEIGDVDVVDASPAGIDLRGAALVWRPETSDLLVRWEPTEMPSARGVATGGNAFEVRSGVVPSAGGTPGVAYSATFTAAGHRMFVEVVGGPLAEARLFNCDAYPCTDLGVLQGSLGSAGLEAHAVVPISALGVASGGTITEISMEAGIGDDRGLVLVLDTLDLENLTLSRPAVDVGVAPPETPPGAVPFQPAMLTGNAFSSSSDASEDASVASVRVCLGTSCSISTMDVAG